MRIFSKLLQSAKENGGGYFVLIDPDTRKNDDLKSFVREICNRGVDAILVGGSLIIDSDFQATVRLIKDASAIPVILFPGSVSQINCRVDAVLYLSLISGRNPNYLFGEHVIAAPTIRKLGIEPISTGYMLFESGKTTTAEFMSNTRPLPANKPEIAMAHALAAQYMGMSTIYLEAGSGAENSVPNDIIRAVSQYVEIPIITGGGIRTPEEARAKIESGSTFVVTGNVYDDPAKFDLLSEFVRATHPKQFS
ncbi:MAG: geranylgeranylglyceryl/heptaprenylglyceryl phosphate synthase [Candidatus Marinimicrobia bacterium CG08_land_8_20_14_0_20_45_22]|nr:MAG: geranylgeranylglyceryl/heptaprenylglyceryl phosphate synthase [Candidatus Marinimicrobia bacterium CG08_land_8_20_14_0_20_45_22]